MLVCKSLSRMSDRGQAGAKKPFLDYSHPLGSRVKHESKFSRIVEGAARCNYTQQKDALQKIFKLSLFGAEERLGASEDQRRLLEHYLPKSLM